MTLPGVKKSVYEALEPQRSEGAEDGMGMEAVEARLNVMHAVFLAIQTSLSLGIDILYKGQHFFHLLFNKHFTETLEVIDMGGFERVCQLHVLVDLAANVAYFYLPDERATISLSGRVDTSSCRCPLHKL